MGCIHKECGIQAASLVGNKLRFDDVFVESAKTIRRECLS